MIFKKILLSPSACVSHIYSPAAQDIFIIFVRFLSKMHAHALSVFTKLYQTFSFLMNMLSASLH